jgi:hypothetical protein
MADEDTRDDTTNIDEDADIERDLQNDTGLQEDFSRDSE